MLLADNFILRSSFQGKVGNGHFAQILADIAAYEIYCKDHKDFKNNKTKVTTERILDVYRKCVETDDFL